MLVSQTVTFFFDNLENSTKALLEILQDARITDSSYRFSGLTAQDILLSGVRLEGEIEDIAEKLEAIPGAVRYEY